MRRRSVLLLLLLLLLVGSCCWASTALADSASGREQRLRQALAAAKELSSTDPVESLTTVDTVLRQAPALGEAHYQRGLLLWKLDRRPEAISALDSAITNEPQNAEYLDERGVAAGTIGDDIQAEHFFRRAVLADGSFVRSRSNLAFALMQLRRGTEAREELQAALRIDPQHQLCTDRLRQLEADLARGTGDEGSSSPPSSPPAAAHRRVEGGGDDESAGDPDPDPRGFESPWLQTRRLEQLRRQRQQSSLPPPPPPSPPPYHPLHATHSALTVTEAMASLSTAEIE
eukprot:COSAG06_NODE_61_length_27084_cov_48.281490_7_plen_287_part_00